jgi:hypothetical protein
LCRIGKTGSLWFTPVLFPQIRECRKEALRGAFYVCGNGGFESITLRAMRLYLSGSNHRTKFSAEIRVLSAWNKIKGKYQKLAVWVGVLILIPLSFFIAVFPKMSI